MEMWCESLGRYSRVKKKYYGSDGANSEVASVGSVSGLLADSILLQWNLQQWCHFYQWNCLRKLSVSVLKATTSGYTFFIVVSVLWESRILWKQPRVDLNLESGWTWESKGNENKWISLNTFYFMKNRVEMTESVVVVIVVVASPWRCQQDVLLHLM